MAAENGNPNLIVRAHTRRECDLRGSAAIDATHLGCVRLSGAATGHDGSLACRIVDVSSGGFGLRTEVFLPVGCLVRVRVGEVEVVGEVKRVQMVGSGPEYYAGLAFASEAVGAADTLMALCDAAEDAA